MIKYDESLKNVFKRADEIRSETGIERIESIFVFGAILETGDCTFSEYLEKERQVDQAEIKSALKRIISERTKHPKVPRLDEKECKFALVYRDKPTSVYRVTNEFSKIISRWIDDVMEFQDEYMKSEGLRIAPSVILSPDSLLSCILFMMPDDVNTFIKRMNLLPIRVKKDLRKRCLDNGIEPVDEDKLGSDWFLDD